ncbi:MAG: DUF5696 domain-containing protein [Oscillospiraceae bacterium]|nr:DUF5696 domain-containing protein [Oscillospiraceae bacterium]
MKLGKKIVLTLLCAAFVITAVYQGYITFRYRLHRDYKAVLSAVDEFESGSPFKGESDPDTPDGMVLAAKNDILKLFVNPETAETAVFDIRTGVTTYTNPPEAADDPLASGVNKSVLQSQLIVEFYDSKRLPGRYNTYDLAVSLEQFELESLNNGFRCTYTIGDMSSPLGIVPMYISEERLSIFAERMSDGGRYVRLRYVDSSDAHGFLQLTELAAGPASLRNLNTYFIEAGYTEDDLAADLEASGVEGVARISFVVPLEYRLDGDSLVVSIPTGHISERGGGKISRIQLIPFFGAGGSEDEGYMVVPNGSGSLIRFNNGRTHVEDYMQYMYGLDPMMQEYTQLGNFDVPRIPYFGIQNEDGGILAEIQKGDTLADITASISGKLNSYNYVFPSFTLRGTNSLMMFGATGNEAEMPVIEPNMAEVNITVRYSFLSDDYHGYSGMAAYARDRLTERGVLTPKSSNGNKDIPLYLNLVGSVSGDKHFLSVAYRGQFPMTTFSQAADIVTGLKNAGINNQIVNYQGWFNRGYYHDVPDKVKLVQQLGNRKELESLSALLEEGGGKLYGDVAFQHATWATRRFKYSIESSRYYGGGMVGVLGQTCPTCLSNMASLGYVETLHNLVSPKFLGRYTDDFIKASGKYNITGISLRDLGSELHSDRKRTEIINREQAKEVVLDSIEKLSKTERNLMFSGGNMYVFGYSDDLINVPTAHNDFYIVDEEIPFYNIILHGYINYAGTPINLSDAYDEAELVVRLIEFGASPHFTFTAENSADMKYTGLNHVYSATFDNWKDTAISIYNQTNSVLSLVSDSYIKNHEILNDGKRRVTYSNGIVIEIDRTAKTYEVRGVNQWN